LKISAMHQKLKEYVFFKIGITYLKNA